MSKIDAKNELESHLSLKKVPQANATAVSAFS
jgi:hypothetical protein